MLLSVKSVKPVTGPTHAFVSVAVALKSASTNAGPAQNPPNAPVSLGIIQPQHLNCTGEVSAERGGTEMSVRGAHLVLDGDLRGLGLRLPDAKVVRALAHGPEPDEGADDEHGDRVGDEDPVEEDEAGCDMVALCDGKEGDEEGDKQHDAEYKAGCGSFSWAYVRGTGEAHL